MVYDGVPTVTFGTGQNEPHTIDDGFSRDEYERGMHAGTIKGFWSGARCGWPG
jgi:hypothetical protein